MSEYGPGQPDPNALTHPWMRIFDDEGHHGVMGLIDVVRRAREILRLDGELPTQDAAVLRLLLSVFLLALSDAADGDPVETWKEAWQDWECAADAVTAYLLEHADEFDLVGPRPFLQSADLEPAGQLPAGLARLVPYDAQWFSVRDPEEPITLAEAVRWLVHAQSYHVAGIQTGQRDDPTVKGGRGYPTGYPAWCGNFGMVIWHGRNLAETILLNLPLGLFPDEKSAGWQRDCPTRSRKDQYPAGPAELFTWPNRRIKLQVDEDGLVRRVQVSYGDTLTPQNMNHLEPMAAWRKSENQSKRAGGGDVLMPQRVDAGRQVWRGIGALLASRAGRPGTASWLDTLVDEGVLPRDLPVRMQVVGIEYGPQNSTVNSVVDDSLTAPLATLLSETLVTTAHQGVELARQGVGQVTFLVTRLALATGGQGDDAAKDRAAKRAYAAVDPEFRQWLAIMTDDDRTDSYVVAWHRRLRRALLSLGRELVAEAGDAGLRGRVIDGQLVDSAAAWARFEYGIRKLTPMADPTNNEQEDR